MPEARVPQPETSAIGERVRMIRRRRGMNLETAAGLAGIGKGYLSMLERGQRRFDKRSLIENLATALGCSVVDLTGQPYPPADTDSVETLTTLPSIRLALNDYLPDDLPDVRPRPIAQLLDLVNAASDHRDQARYSAAGRGLGDLLVELQVYANGGTAVQRSQALAALVEGWVIAGAVTRNAGYVDLAATAARRAFDTAVMLGDPAMTAFAKWFWSYSLIRMAVRNRAVRLLTESLDELAPAVRLSDTSTLAAEMAGLVHLTLAQTAARERQAENAHAHLDEASAIAARIGERNSLRRHFGPTNVAAWRLSIGIELGEGERSYVQTLRTPLNTDALGSKERTAALHLDLARALAQESGPRDWDAVRHLDTADRVAPQLIRPDPIARELVASLNNRVKLKTWELDSLRHRFGLG